MAKLSEFTSILDILYIFVIYQLYIVLVYGGSVKYNSNWPGVIKQTIIHVKHMHMIVHIQTIIII